MKNSVLEMEILPCYIDIDFSVNREYGFLNNMSMVQKRVLTNQNLEVVIKITAADVILSGETLRSLKEVYQSCSKIKLSFFKEGDIKEIKVFQGNVSIEKLRAIELE